MCHTELRCNSQLSWQRMLQLCNTSLRASVTDILKGYTQSSVLLKFSSCVAHHITLQPCYNTPRLSAVSVIMLTRDGPQFLAIKMHYN